MLLDHSLLRGDHVLKSGHQAPWFLDVSRTACRPVGIRIIADVLLRLIDDEVGRFHVDAIGGLTMGADPIAHGAAAVAAVRGWRLRSFSVRKEAKTHGAQGRIVGAVMPGDKVVVVEDVSTRGTSALEAVEALRAYGATPVLVVPLVDRGGRCVEVMQEAGVPCKPVLTAPGLGFPYDRAE